MDYGYRQQWEHKLSNLINKMSRLTKYKQQTADYIAAMIIVDNFILACCLWAIHQNWHVQTKWLVMISGCVAIFLALLVSLPASPYVTKPVSVISQVINHISPSGRAVAAPNIKKTILGQDFIAALAKKIYQLNTYSTRLSSRLDAKNVDLNSNVVAKSLPLPLFILNQELDIIFANKAALEFIHKTESEVLNKNLHMVLNMTFKEGHNFDDWLAQNLSKTVVANKKWINVQLEQSNLQTTPQLFDLAAYYNRNHPFGYEIMLVMFDHSN